MSLNVFGFSLTVGSCWLSADSDVRVDDKELRKHFEQFGRVQEPCTEAAECSYAKDP